MTQISVTFKQLYISKSPALIKFALRFVDRYAAEDIVQDAFLKLWDEKYEDLSEEDSRRLLYTFVRNLCFDHIRHLKIVENYKDKRMLDLTLKELEQYSDIEKQVVKKDLYKYVLNKVELLPERRKEVFKLTYLEEKKTTEIAEILGLSIRTVENNLYKALMFLREQLPSSLYILIIYFFI